MKPQGTQIHDRDVYMTWRRIRTGLNQCDYCMLCHRMFAIWHHDYAEENDLFKSVQKGLIWRLPRNFKQTTVQQTLVVYQKLHLNWHYHCRTLKADGKLATRSASYSIGECKVPRQNAVFGSFLSHRARVHDNRYLQFDAPL